jgi:uncharacterized protein (DUF849 family)
MTPKRKRFPTLREPKKLIIEVTVTEILERKEYPDTPYSPNEIAEQSLACVEAGASIIHLHARDPKTGAQRFQDVELYAKAMHQIMRHSDAICYPTWPPRSAKMTGIDRFRHVFELVKDPLIALQFADVDTGTMLRGRYDAGSNTLLAPDHMYANTHGDTLAFLEKCNQVGLKPRFGMRELGGIRHLLMFMDMGLIAEPLILKTGWNDDLLFNLQPIPKAILDFWSWLPDDLDYQWFTQSQGRSHHIVNNTAILAGGHIRTGIGDNIRYAGRLMGNVEQVRKVVATAHAMDRGVANPREAREILSLEPLAVVRAKRSRRAKAA